ncbi:hypothetical protein IKG13_01680 [Candidatus Saccharibacteria bacterium]|nr:hypothetical protein [Candidatus Saccharibacteria bacterium]
MNPQNQFPQGNGAPVGQPNNFFNAAETANPSQLDVKTATTGNTQMNVVNAVNANGIVSGRKVVDYIWQRTAICAIVIASGMFIAVIVMVFIANAFNTNAIKQEEEKIAVNDKLTEIYNTLNVESQEDALTTLAKDEILSGSDIQQIRAVITQKYGAITTIDPNDTSVNFVKSNGMYRVASLKMTNAAGTTRALFYARKSDNLWKPAAYNTNDDKNPCKDSTDEEKKALFGVVSCPSVVIEDEEE